MEPPGARPTETELPVDKERIPVQEKLVGCGGDPFVAAVVGDMLPSERDAWLRLYYAPEYRAELRRIASYFPEEDEDE